MLHLPKGDLGTTTAKRQLLYVSRHTNPVAGCSFKSYTWGSSALQPRPNIHGCSIWLLICIYSLKAQRLSWIATTCRAVPQRRRPLLLPSNRCLDFRVQSCRICDPSLIAYLARQKAWIYLDSTLRIITGCIHPASAIHFYFDWHSSSTLAQERTVTRLAIKARLKFNHFFLWW